MKLVDLVYVDGRFVYASGENRKAAAMVLRVDPAQVTDNVGFAVAAEALKHFTSQNQWPPATGAK